MKLRLIALILLSLSSCTKYLEVDMEPQPARIVVNCLFSPDRNWDVKLTKTKDITNNRDIYIGNAQVEIHTESGQITLLNYNGKGHYIADSKPKPNEAYQLKIDVPEYETITAQSSIPVSATASLGNLEINWSKYMYPNDLIDYDVFPLTIFWNEPVAKGYLLFRGHIFDPAFGYKRYRLPALSLENLKNRGIPEKGIERLAALTDEWQANIQVFFNCVDGLGDIVEQVNYYNLIDEELQEMKVSTRELEAFLPAGCFSNDSWLSNISYNTYTVLGKSEFVEEASLFYCEPNLRYAMEKGNKQGKEYWLEVTQGDDNFYEYYRTYILQISQRVNPYSEPVSVYSNIKNGVGVFAGYHRQMIHLITY